MVAISMIPKRWPIMGLRTIPWGVRIINLVHESGGTGKIQQGGQKLP